MGQVSVLEHPARLSRINTDAAPVRRCAKEHIKADIGQPLMGAV